MARITFVGAGSYGFTREQVRDILTFRSLRDATLVLMDIDTEKLEFADRSARRTVELGRYPARVETAMERAHS